MIITCSSCLIKFSLDDSKIPAKGIKVRCSRCQHVFHVIPLPETPGTKEEVVEDFESFAKFHEELMEPSRGKEEIPFPPEEEKKKMTIEEDERGFLFSEEATGEKMERAISGEPVRKEDVESQVIKPKRMLHEEKKRPSLVLVLVLVLVFLFFGFFYFWGEVGSGGGISPFLEYPITKITHIWNKIWGTEKEGLIVRDLNGYEEKLGGVPLFIIEGKVNNQSRYVKKYIKIRVVIFNEDRIKVDERETICGRLISRGELKNLPASFFQGEMAIKPQTEKEMVTPSGKTAPFIIIFKNLSSAKEFKVEIIEAPKL